MILNNVWTTPEKLPKDLILAKKLLFDTCDFNCTQPEKEAESADYEAFRFKINDKFVVYRTAKITPTKTGQFVTLWERNHKGIIEPLHILDDIDFAIISTRSDDYFGQFIFSKSVLHTRKILSDNHQDGKLGFRIYPPWDETTNKTAQKSQMWQLDCFFNMSDEKSIDLMRAKLLFGNL